MMCKKILEINVESDIIQELHQKFSESKNENTIKDIVWLLYEISLINSGFTLEHSTPFCNRIHRMIRLGLGLDDTKYQNQNKTAEDDNNAEVDSANIINNIIDSEKLEPDSTMEQLD